MEKPVPGRRSLFVELFWLSLVSLFCELLVIRWLSADIRAFSVLKSFPLATCFVGLGAGCALGNDRHYRWSPAALLIFVLLTRVVADSVLGTLPFPSESIYNWIRFDISSGSGAAGMQRLYLLLFALIILVVLAGPFLLAVAIGSRLGLLFNSLPALPAYCLNVAGALAGTVLFAALSFMSLSPQLLLMVPAAYFILAIRAPARLNLTTILPCLAAAAIAIWPSCETDTTVWWSPYQRLDLEPLRVTVAGKDVVAGYSLKANKVGYQGAYNLSGEFLANADLPYAARKQLTERTLRHDFPYWLTRPDSVLIVGSGMGNDVAAALRAGARHIDAVDIDPVILELGRRFHPERPYAQRQRVQTICEDARRFFNTCRTKYDLVVFSHLDSHAVLSQSSAVRLDNFVYTRESIESALRLLKPGGLAVVSFHTRAPWFVDRLFQTIESAAGYAPRAYTDSRDSILNVFFVAGEPVASGAFALPSQVQQHLRPIHSRRGERCLTDDWPYLYLAPVGLDVGYLAIVCEIVLLSVLIGWKTLAAGSSGRMWQMFFLGAGFLLLELQAISRLALIYGSTWLTSSVVIASVLLIILLANVIVMRSRAALTNNETALYTVLLALLAVSYGLPVRQILALNIYVLPELVVTAVSITPMFCAALIFGQAFARAQYPGRALGFNLFGAVLGAMLEYCSNYVGINNMVVLAGSLYMLSFAAVRIGAQQRSTVAVDACAPRPQADL